VSWTQTPTLDCRGCHGSDSAPAFPSLAGEPNYASVGPAHANSHRVHLLGAGDCATCHAGSVDGSGKIAGSGHINGNIDVVFQAGRAGARAAWDSGAASCSAILCHSDGTSVATGVPVAGSPVWGGMALACDACHGFPPAYPNGTPKANTHYAHNFGCATCHAAVTANGSSITGSGHANHVYDVSPGSGVSFSYVFAASGGSCSDISCHNGNGAVWGTTLVCGNCHQVSPGGD
jgi:predicted CxxxxCH...CXXCH cytochrome family protein